MQLDDWYSKIFTDPDLLGADAEFLEFWKDVDGSSGARESCWT